jgi:hypothetical protein
MASCGSDHFPMYVNLQFDPESQGLNSTPVAQLSDLEQASEKINAPTN